MKYPIGIQEFEKIINGGYVYVDKTDLIYRLVTEGSIYFLSRPRRFGKSLLVSTLECYFQGKKELFRGLAIDSLEKEWAQYPVFHIDFNGSNFTQGGTLQQKIEGYVASWEREYGKDSIGMTLGDRFAYVLKRAHQQTGRRAVVLIDEYDKPILDVLDTRLTTEVDGERRPIEDVNREILKGFYSVFKAADADLQFVLLTGVTYTSQGDEFGGFNQAYDITLDQHYEALCGITETELYDVFEDSIKELAEKNSCSDIEMKEMLKAKFGGFSFGSGSVHIYNPFNILCVFKSQKMEDYGSHNTMPGYLVRLLKHTQVNMDEMAGRHYNYYEIIGTASVGKILPLIFQNGYFTVKDYDMHYNTYLLDYPNDVERNVSPHQAYKIRKSASSAKSCV